MQKDNSILEELREIAPAVANLGNKNLYTVPAGYFNTLAADITRRINSADLLSSNANPYSVPDNYFEELAAIVLKRIKSQQKQAQSNTIRRELDEIAPILNNINKSNLYSVPTGYFENSSFEVHKYTPTAKIISIGNNLRRWVMYSAAASVLFILGTTSYLYVNHHMKTVDKSLTIEQRLANLDDDDIINYLKYDQGSSDLNLNSGDDDMDIKTLLKNASDKEIEDYLDDGSVDIEKNVKGI